MTALISSEPAVLVLEDGSRLAVDLALEIATVALGGVTYRLAIDDDLDDSNNERNEIALRFTVAAS